MKIISNKTNNIIVILSLLFAAGNFNVYAGQKFKLNVDRFTDKKTASYDVIPKKECKLTKSLKSRISSCFFMNSTESSMYPLISFGTTSNGWDLLSYSSKEVSNAILTYDDGTTKKIAIPAKYDGDSLYDTVLGG